MLVKSTEEKADAQEKWLPIAGYEGLYEVSNFGHVQSLDRPVRYFLKGVWGIRIAKGRIFSPLKGRYLMVALSRDSKEKGYTVHSLVARAFIGERPKGLQINHKDFNKTNNHIENLEYCTPKQNMIHAYKNGFIPIRTGERTSNAKLKESQVLEIRRLYALGNTSKTELALKFGISRYAIRSIIIRENWKHI